MDSSPQDCSFWFIPCRCFTKTNGTFSSSPLSVVPVVAPCPQDGLEMKPLGHPKMPACQASPPPNGGPSPGESLRDDAAARPAPPPCCQDSRSEVTPDSTEDAAGCNRGTGRHLQPKLPGRLLVATDTGRWRRRVLSVITYNFLKRLGGGVGYFEKS